MHFLTEIELFWFEFQRFISTGAVPISSIRFLMLSSNETFSALLALCAGNSPVPSDAEIDVLFDLRQLFETPSLSLWRHCMAGNDMGLNQRQVITWSNDKPVYLRIYASPYLCDHPFWYIEVKTNLSNYDWARTSGQCGRRYIGSILAHWLRSFSAIEIRRYEIV